MKITRLPCRAGLVACLSLDIAAPGYAAESDLPPFGDYSMANRTYRYFTGKPLFAFGHGLTDTTFDHQKLTLSSPTAKPDEITTATVTVRNFGKRDSDEVVQLYATAIKPPVPMPLRQLIGFKCETIKAGETKTVEIAVSAQLLRRRDDVGKRSVVDAGAYRIAAGPASDPRAARCRTGHCLGQMSLEERLPSQSSMLPAQSNPREIKKRGKHPWDWMAAAVVYFLSSL